jgi:archaemetzincin
MRYIYLQPFISIDKNFLEKIGTKLQEIFKHPYKILKSKELPINAFFRRRRQWHSTTVLELAINKDIPKDSERILGIVDADLYVENLNFVFGEADPKNRSAIISIFRLRPEYYMLPKDDKLFHQRVIKESIHELGHTYGLPHCENNKCIMFFSNTLADTDSKGPGFCSKCREKLT